MTPVRVVANRALLVVALSVAGCFERDAQTTSSAEDGSALLRRALEAEKSLVYTGEKRTICGEEGEGRATRMKVSRTVAGKTFLEWDEGDGSTRRWVYESRAGWRDDPDLLFKNYVVSVDPADGPAVAWRETRHVSVRGRRPGRPSLDLYLDKERSIVLREEIRDFDGRLWLTKVFDTIEFREPDEPSASAHAEPLSDPRVGDASASSLPLAVVRPPDGFVRTGGPGGRDADGFLREDWTDGLAAFSVFERAPGERPKAEGELTRRSCSGRASVSGVFAGVEVKVMGNLPAADLESVVREMSPTVRRN
jgi:hypothetical protein